MLNPLNEWEVGMFRATALEHVDDGFYMASHKQGTRLLMTYLAYELALNCGLTRIELLELSWHYIDCAEKKTVYCPKTGRVIPISDKLAKMLELAMPHYVKEFKRNGPDMWFIPSTSSMKRPNEIESAGSFSWDLKNDIKEKINAPFNITRLRDTFIKRLFGSNLSLNHWVSMFEISGLKTLNSVVEYFAKEAEDAREVVTSIQDAPGTFVIK